MREEGYYWVKSMGHWSCAFWTPKANKWFYVGSIESFTDINFDEIDENRITREAHIRTGLSATLSARKVMKETEGKLFGLL